MNAIEVKNLTKVFGKFTAVDNINFNVKQGEIFGFLGANGAGKSTTIRMLIGILEPTYGDALVSGYSIKNQSDLVKQNIGYMSQKFSLYNDLTVVENIRFFAGIYGLDGKKYEERKEWVLKVADLENMGNVITGSLPGGIKQRLALGTAVIHEPKIVFLDEPTSGVDPISRRNFWDLINELSEGGTTVLVTTHYLDEAEFCNDIILINAGKLIAQGNSQELKSNYIKNPILEIESDRVVDSLEILEKEKWVGETSIFGNYIHVILNDSTINEQHIFQLLQNKNGIAVKRVEKITPTLEDVFIHLIEKDSKKNVQ
jgi:ABC-2 type transport system ATP-binding protein